MQSVLTQINSVPGVVGSMVCNDEGRLAAQLFPPLFDTTMLQDAATYLADSTIGLQDSTGGMGLMDLRFADARIVVRPMAHSLLLLLCTRAVNMQLLSISLNVAVKKLERLVATLPPESAPVPAQAAPDKAANTGGAVAFAAPVSKAQAPAEIKSSDKGVLLTIQVLRKTGGSYWDNMMEMVSINRVTSVFLSDHFNTGAFKKVVLTNTRNNKKKKFPVSVIKDDREHLYDGKAIVSLASMEQLGVTDGDQVIASIDVGGGMFGWENI
ncbi:MAG: hypothetical protein HXX17_11745 [Geobacteraceae bacterium]|nr:hypothetical protein [Geobacteraceae bacterium]